MIGYAVPHLKQCKVDSDCNDMFKLTVRTQRLEETLRTKRFTLLSSASASYGSPEIRRSLPVKRPNRGRIASNPQWRPDPTGVRRPRTALRVGPGTGSRCPLDAAPAARELPRGCSSAGERE